MSIFENFEKKLQAEPKSIVFTEGTDARILSAASRLLAGKTLKVILLGEPEAVKKAFLTASKRRIFCETVSSQKTSLRSPSPCTARVWRLFIQIEAGLRLPAGRPGSRLWSAPGAPFTAAPHLGTVSPKCPSHSPRKYCVFLSSEVL